MSKIAWCEGSEKLGHSASLAEVSAVKNAVIKAHPEANNFQLEVKDIGEYDQSYQIVLTYQRHKTDAELEKEKQQADTARTHRLQLYKRLKSEFDE